MIKRTLTASFALIAAAAGLAACSNPTGKSWAISYELTADRTGTVTGISYGASPDRYQDEVTDHQLSGPLGVPWKLDVIVSAGRDTSVTATPSGQSTLSCRILLDKTKELAKATAPGPGKPVTCKHTTDS